MREPVETTTSPAATSPECIPAQGPQPGAITMQPASTRVRVIPSSIIRS